MTDDALRALAEETLACGATMVGNEEEIAAGVLRLLDEAASLRARLQESDAR